MKRVREQLVFPITLVIFLVASSSAAALTSGGGLYMPPPPTISAVICLSKCGNLHTVGPGGTVQISGKNLGEAESVSFRTNGKRVRSTATVQSGSLITAKVPSNAITGKVRVISDGSASPASPAKINVDDSIKLVTGTSLRLSAAQTSPAKAYKFGTSKPKISYIVSGGRKANDLRIDVVRKGGGGVIRSMVRKAVPSGSTQSVRWNGKAGGKLAPNGKYKFVVRSLDGKRAKITGSVRRARKKGTNPFSFHLYGFKFPVRGHHSYGDGLGAGRGHQGQDLLANCGLKVVAARGGKVYYNDYQAGGAGNYVVINTWGTGGQSNVYMHLRKPSKLKVGQKVKTGQFVGIVGSTGRSTACHLHFEKWSGPGWYQGGTVMNPTPPLRRWDRYS